MGYALCPSMRAACGMYSTVCRDIGSCKLGVWKATETGFFSVSWE